MRIKIQGSGNDEGRDKANEGAGKYDSFIAEGLFGSKKEDVPAEEPVKAQEATFQAAKPVPRQPKTYPFAAARKDPFAEKPEEPAAAPEPAPTPTPLPQRSEEPAGADDNRFPRMQPDKVYVELPSTAELGSELEVDDPMPIPTDGSGMSFDELMDAMSPVDEGESIEAATELEELDELGGVIEEEEPAGPDLSEYVPRSEYEDLEQRHERFMADWENYKRRTEQNVEQAKLNANANILKAMIPALDDFIRAIDHAESMSEENPGVADVATGMKAINRKLLTALENEGLVVINPLDEPFDMNCHQAVEKRDVEGVPTETVVEVYQVGYIMNGKVIRPAIVAVAS